MLTTFTRSPVVGLLILCYKPPKLSHWCTVSVVVGSVDRSCLLPCKWRVAIVNRSRRVHARRVRKPLCKFSIQSTARANLKRAVCETPTRATWARQLINPLMIWKCVRRPGSVKFNKQTAVTNGRGLRTSCFHPLLTLRRTFTEVILWLNYISEFPQGPAALSERLSDLFGDADIERRVILTEWANRHAEGVWVGLSKWRYAGRHNHVKLAPARIRAHYWYMRLFISHLVWYKVEPKLLLLIQ